MFVETVRFLREHVGRPDAENDRPESLGEPEERGSFGGG